MTKQQFADRVAQGSNAHTWSGKVRYFRKHILPEIKSVFAQQNVALKYPEDAWRRRPGPYDRHTTRAQWLHMRHDERMNARAERICLELGLWPKCDAEQYAEQLTRQYLAPIERDLSHNWPFRRSESKWAGGHHTVHISLGAYPAARCETTKVWGESRYPKPSWSGTDSDAYLTVTRQTLDLFRKLNARDGYLVRTLRTRDGSIVVDAELVGPREFKAAWLKQGRGFDIKIERGWIIRDYHVKAATIGQARKKAAIARQAALASTLRARQAIRAKRAELDNKRAELEGFRGLYLSTADSLAAGNCASQTATFAAQMFRQLGASGECAVRADVVLAERDDYYTRRALGAAINREEIGRNN